MLKRMLTVGLAAVLLGSCGGSEKETTPKLGTGALYTFVGDAPACDLLSFPIRITGLTLTPQGQTNKVTVYSGAIVRLNFASLRDFCTILNVASVPEGTYEAANITFSLPQLVVFDPTQSPPSRVILAEFTTLTPTVPIQPPLTVLKDQVNVLRLDFDLARSVELDADEQVTGRVTPILKATPIIATESEGFGELNNLIGFVRSVSPYSAVQDFTGSFSLQLLAGSGPNVTVNLTEATHLFGTPALNQLETGRYAEVEAFVDAKGNIVAKSVEVEERAFVELDKVAFLGYVTSVTNKDTDGNVTQFNLYVREEEPSVDLDVSLNSTVVVNVTATTAFQYSSRDTNFASLPFDASAVAVGQELVVHGQFTKTQDQPTTVDPSKIYLKLQTVQGRFSSLVRVGADGKTGAFWMTPCSSLFQGAPILVFTSSQTAFLNVFGLTDLRPQPTLLVMGLPFYQRDAGTINDVSVPAGTIVLLAKQVHQFE